MKRLGKGGGVGEEGDVGKFEFFNLKKILEKILQNQEYFLSYNNL